MKTIPFLILILFVIASCKKESKDSSPNNTVTLQKGITYPDSVYYGRNILDDPDSTMYTINDAYSMGAVLEKDASLYLIVTNQSDTTGGTPLWFYGDEVGWVGTTYDFATGTQKFVATQTGKIDLQIFFDAFGGKTGKCKIDFYENGSTVTRTKHFTWH